MGRVRIWLIVLVPALAVMAGARGERWPDPVALATVSAHAPPSDVGSPCEALSEAHFRLGRGLVTPGPQRAPTRPHRASPAALPAGRPAASAPSPYTAPECARFDRALRDGTFSSRSTGLPPPIA